MEAIAPLEPTAPVLVIATIMSAVSPLNIVPGPADRLQFKLAVPFAVMVTVLLVAETVRAESASVPAAPPANFIVPFPATE